ncbi:hypothetical protein QFC21_007205 [Naganishia friedmannii]|uniref:Uncharacterized protein n=1 Tax=Naganishia friedmannii TaxID=89922 RepID=A0ACC2UXT6_9TREE|nr:hypothetical protein QFC21_007205 [Naganishia friedmannii]
MTRTTGLKRPPQILTSAGPDPPANSRSGRSHTAVTGRKGPPSQYAPQITTMDDDDDDDDDEEESEGDDEEEEGDDGSSEEDDSSEEEGFVRPTMDDSEEFSKRQLELIQLASDLSANDDLLSCIFVDTFGSMAAKDDLGVYYHQGDFLKPYFNRAEVVKMAQETIVQGNVQAALDRSLRLAVFRSRIGVLRSTSQIKKFVAHLKRYLMLYHPSSRVEIRTTDRYRFTTQKSELAVHATVDLDPGLTEYVQVDLRNAYGNSSAATSHDGEKQPSLNGIPNQLNGQRMAAELQAQGITDWQMETKPPMLVLDEITGAMEVMPKTWEQRLSGNNIEDDPDGKNAVSAAQRRLQARNVPYGDMGINGDAEEEEGTSGAAGPSSQPMDGRKKMAEIRDFSVVNSGRQGLMLFLGPGRFINHDCSPNVELITTKRNVITFRVLRRIRTGEELTTWYGDNYFGPGNRDCLCLTCEHAHRGGFTRVINDSSTSGITTKATEGSSSKRTSDAARRSAGQVTSAANISDGALDTGITIAVIDEGMESPEESMVNGDDDESSSDKDVDMDGGQDEEKVSCCSMRYVSHRILSNLDVFGEHSQLHVSVEDVVEDADTKRRSARRFSSFSSLPHRMTDSLSISTSARASPESSAAGSSPTRESARNKRRAAARGRERTSNMIQHPFGYSKVNGKNGMPNTSTAGEYGSEAVRESTRPHSERDEPGTLRCTVCLSIMDPVWVSNRYVEQCRRCIRHKAIYGFKWPARAKVEEQPYPPANMRPIWWVPPKISRHRFRSITPSIIETHNSDDGQQRSDGEREANAQEEEARREVKRVHRWEVLQAEGAAKFRKDLEVARDLMRRMEEEHAAEREAAKSQPRQHNGGGSWGKYEYVWEEEEQPVVLQEGSKRSRRPTALPESQPPVPKRRKTEESAGESTRGHSRKPETKHSAPPKREEKAHPASRRGQRPKPTGPIFSAMPASPSAEIMPVDDFDIMPLTTDRDPSISHVPIALTDDDSYDSDVEVIATNVARARAAQGGLEEDYGSNVNPISLSAEEEDKANDNNNSNGNSNGNGNESSDEDIFYSTHFSASALHYLMPSVTDGSVNTGGVPKGTTDGQSTGVGSSRLHPSATKGISPLKHREVFRGTLSTPDVHPDVQPESYKQPKALTERGKGTRAALEALEREGREGSRCGVPPPLLHSAEAEIARARQAAAFMKGARRKPTRKTQVSRLSRQWHPSPSPTSFDEVRRDEDGSRVDEDENSLQEMLDTIVSSQLMIVDNVNDTDAAELSPRKSFEETSSFHIRESSMPLEPISGKAVGNDADPPRLELDARAVSPPQQDFSSAELPAETAGRDANVVAEPLTQSETTPRSDNPLSEMTVTHEDDQPTVVEASANTASDVSAEKEDIVAGSTEKKDIAEVLVDKDDIAEVMAGKEDVPEETMTQATSSVDQRDLKEELDALAEEEAGQSPVQQSSTQGQPDVLEESAVTEEVISEKAQQSPFLFKGQDFGTEDSSMDLSQVHVPTTPKDNNGILEPNLNGLAAGDQPVADVPSANELDLIREATSSPSSDFQAMKQATPSTREGSAYPNLAEKMSVDQTLASPSTTQDGDIASTAIPLNRPETVKQTPPVTDGSTEPIAEPEQSPLPLDSTITPAKSTDEHVAKSIPIGSETRLAPTPPDASPTGHLCATGDVARDDSGDSPQVDWAMEMESGMSTSGVIRKDPVESKDFDSLSEERHIRPLQQGFNDNSNEDMQQTTSPAENVSVKPSMDVDFTPGMERDLAPALDATAQPDVTMENGTITDSAVDQSPATTRSTERETEEESLKTMEIETSITLAREHSPATTMEPVTNEVNDTTMVIDTNTGLTDDNPLAMTSAFVEPVMQEGLPAGQGVTPLESDIDGLALREAMPAVGNKDGVRIASRDQQTASSTEVAAPNQPDANPAVVDEQVPQGTFDLAPSTAIQATGHADSLDTEKATDPPEPPMRSDLPVIDSLPPLEVEPSVNEFVEQSTDNAGIAELPRFQVRNHASVSTPARANSTATQTPATLKRRRRGGNAAIPRDTTIVVLSSDDDVEIIPPPKKVVLRAPTGSSALPSPHPIRTPGSQGRQASTSINPISLGTPMSQRISVISSPVISRSSRIANNASPSTSTTAHVSAPVVTPDARKGSQKGALFLPSTRKALESRRTIEALRRIQLANAGRTEPSDGEPSEPTATDTSVTGVDTSWQPETSNNAGAGSAWGTPAAPPTAVGESSESNANAGWGDSSAVPTDNSSGWGAPPETTSTSDSWNPQTLASSNVDNAWNAEPAAKSNGNDGWNNPTTVTSTANDGWDTQPTISPNAGAAWTTSSININEPSVSSASLVVRPESTSAGWGEAPSSAPVTNTGFNMSSKGAAKPSDGWDSTPGTNHASSNGWPQAPTQEPSTDTSWGDNVQNNVNISRNTGWADATQSTRADDDWGASTSTPTQAWVTQQKADTVISARSASFPHNQAASASSQLQKPPSATVDPNAWEPESESAKTATDWSIWDTPTDTPSVNISTSGWGDQPARQTLNGWNPPSQISARGDPELSVVTSGNDGPPSALAQTGWDVPASAFTSRNDERSLGAPPTKPKRQTAEDFWQPSASPSHSSAPVPYTVTSPAKKVDASAGWGSWEPSDSSAKPQDDGWGNPAYLLDMMADLDRHLGPGHPVGLHHPEPLNTGQDPPIGTSVGKLNAVPAMYPELLTGEDMIALDLERLVVRAMRMTEGIASIMTSQLQNIVANIDIPSDDDLKEEIQNPVTLQDESLSEGILENVEAKDPRDDLRRDETLKDMIESPRDITRREGKVKDTIEGPNDVKGTGAAAQSVCRSENEDESVVEDRVVMDGGVPISQKIERIPSPTTVTLTNDTLNDVNRGEENLDTRRWTRGPWNAQLRMGSTLDDGIPRVEYRTRYIPVVSHTRLNIPRNGGSEDSLQVVHLKRLIDEPRYPEARTSTNAMPLGRKMRVFGKASTDNAPRGPRSASIRPASVQPEKSQHADESNVAKEKTSELNASDSVDTQTTSSHSWGEPTAAATSTAEQGSGWDSWGSSSATNIPQVNAGW